MPQQLLQNYSDTEKGAYLGAIASIATADHSASEEELEYLNTLSTSAGLSPEQTNVVTKAATELTADELQPCLGILKNSELRFSLVTDLISFAKADGQYSEEEKANIEKIARELNIDQHQFSLLDEFAEKTAGTDVQANLANVQQPGGDKGFLSSLGLGGLEDKLKNSGINVGSLAKGLLGVAGPMILASLVNRGLRGRGTSGSNPFGMGGSGSGFGGGFGSLIGMLSGGRGFNRSGGLLSRILKF